MPTVKTEKYFQKVLFVHLLFTTLIHPLCAYVFIGDYHYYDFLSFMKSGSRCSFLPGNIKAYITKERSTADDQCLIFMKEINNYSANSKLTKAKVKYTAFGKTYTFDLKQPMPCKPAANIQNVEMVLICEGKTIGNGIICNRTADCDREREVCSRYPVIDKQICIPKRHINESCDEYSTCYDNNSECKYSAHTRTCQCLRHHREIDGRCVKIGLTLGENCFKEEQCSGSNYASRCLRNQNTETVCSCMKGYIASGSYCIKDELSLNETCEVNKQCSGTENANTCSTNGKSEQICGCNHGYIEKQSRCYKMNLHLFESCDWSEQCTGSHGANECKVVEEQQICYCPDGKAILEGSCFNVGLTLDEPCYVDRQCTGTANSGVCMASINTEQVCHCNRGYIRYNESCLQANKSMYEECDIDLQCNGSYEGGVCKEIGYRKLCLCANGYDEDNTDFTCRKAKAAMSWIEEKINKLLLIAVGGFFGMMMCSISTILLALKERIQNRRSRFKRDKSTRIPTESIHYSIAENSNIRFIEKAQRDSNNRYHHNENSYDTANSIQERETGHLYSLSEPEPYGEENHYDGTYCHLYKKSLMLSADLYGIQNLMLVSSPSTMGEESS